MFQSFLSHTNYLAILVSAVAYFILGSLWFSLLFGNAWSTEVEKQGIKIKEPTKKEIGAKMIQTFVCNLIAAFATAFVIYATGASEWSHGIQIGLICGFGFGAMAITIAGTWESRPF